MKNIDLNIIKKSKKQKIDYQKETKIWNTKNQPE